jgi:hypothetical protein
MASKGLQGEFVWPYFLSDKEKIGTRPNIRACIKSLESLGLIELKRKKDLIELKPEKDRKYYGLTFKGLLFALKRSMVRPSEARELRLKSKIDLPLEVPRDPKITYVDTSGRIEEKHPEDFYNFLARSIDLDFFGIGILTTWMIMEFISLFLRFGAKELIDSGFFDPKSKSWKESGIVDANLSENQRQYFIEFRRLFPSINRKNYEELVEDFTNTKGLQESSELQKAKTV